jgi:spore cortex biosynthesis protein YabQ
MSDENAFLVYSFLLGLFITFVYDWLRIIRRVLPHGSFLVSLEDLCFWGYCGIQVFLMMYHENNGTLRWFAVFGAMFGMVAYKMTVSNILVKYISLGLCKILGWISKLFRFLCKPFALICRKTAKAATAVNGKRKTASHYIKMKLTHLFKMVKIVLSKQ